MIQLLFFFGSMCSSHPCCNEILFVCHFLRQGNNVSGQKKFRKGDRSRRIWTEREEEILAASLVELVARGWKSDNGFRSGYLAKIEDNIRAEFPKTDIKGQPHIVSKMSAWKKNYISLRSILSRSGVGFNADGDYKIDINDDQWEQVVRVRLLCPFMVFANVNYKHFLI